MLSEADAGANSRTGPLPTRESDVSAGDRKTGTVPPPTSQLKASAKVEGSGISPRPTQRALETIATPPRPVKRTQQGLATLPRGAFVDPRTAPPPPSEEEDIDAPSTRTIEIDVD